MSIAANRFTIRSNAVREQLAAQSLDALLVTHLPNVAYLTGLHASAGAALVSADKIYLVVDSRYLTVAVSLADSDGAPRGLTVVSVQQSYEETIRELLERTHLVRVGAESEHLAHSRWLWLTQALAGSSTTLVPVTGVVESGRVIKDAHEVEVLREAGRLIADAVRPVTGLVHEGRTEREIAADIDHTLSGMGFEDRAFPTIVASGPNSALPHARPSARRVAAGELVLLDFGGVHSGYCVDLSRTICLGSPPDEAARLHAAVREAQEAAVRAVRPGVVASGIDDVARSVLARHRLADTFGHSTGHGLGLEVHEAPRIGRAGQPGSDVMLTPGMVFTIEPGVYVPDVGGVRIEDDVLVTETGCEMLTEAPRGLTPNE